MNFLILLTIFAPMLLLAEPSTSSPHWLTKVTVLDNDEYTLELEDGSIWKVSNYDGKKAAHWQINDPLTITQNSRWFSQHEYRMINRNNGTSIESTLYTAPIRLGAYSRYILEINYAEGQITLSDNMRWEASSADVDLFKKWEVDDYVILGTNSDTNLWDSESDFLLINVATNTSVRFKQYKGD